MVQKGEVFTVNYFKLKTTDFLYKNIKSRLKTTVFKQN